MIRNETVYERPDLKTLATVLKIALLISLGGGTPKKSETIHSELEHSRHQLRLNSRIMPSLFALHGPRKICKIT